MIEPYLPPELWFKICISFNPQDVTNVILLLKNEQNKKILKSISLELCKTYYSNIDPLIGKLFMLKININKITTKKMWIDYYYEFNYCRGFQNENLEIFTKYSQKFKNEIKDKKNKEKYGNILRIKSFI